MSDPCGRIRLVAVVGPTASGKTRLAIELARRFGGEVVSADSMQVYRHMDIGTAKPRPEEMCGVPHHMIDVVDPSKSFSVADYVKMASMAVRDIASRGALPIMAGGTGLYVESLLTGNDFGPAHGLPEYRARLEQIAAHGGGAMLKRMLEEVDPESAAALHDNDIKRLIRALEVYQATGVPISEWKRRSRNTEPPYDACVIGLDFCDRAKLYARIDARVDSMIRQGLEAETRMLIYRYGKDLPTAFQAIGYKEMLAHINGDMSFDQTVEIIKRESRRYAKRQLTWFRRDKNVRWIYVDMEKDESAVVSKACDMICDWNARRL